MIAPAWNAQNALTGSCMTGGGLTAQGKEFVRRAQKLGMILDVSHISEKAFWDLCDITEKPFVASHSNSRAICKHVRNLTDEQFKALCEAGGTAGLNLYGAFLRDEGRPTLETSGVISSIFWSSGETDISRSAAIWTDAACCRRALPVWTAMQCLRSGWKTGSCQAVQ